MFISADLKTLEEIGSVIYAQETLLNKLWKESTDLICVVNGDYLVKVNPSWTRELGWTSKELTSKPYLEFVHPDDVQKTKEIVSRPPETLTKDAQCFTNRYITKKEEYKSIQWHVSSVTVEGEIYCLAKVV